MNVDELRRQDSVLLAVACSKVAEDEKTLPEDAAQARALKHEWVKLIARQTPPPRSVHEYVAIRTEIDQLRMRMAEFLAPLLSSL